MLVLCSTCSRHVKTVPCPFCGGEGTSAVKAHPGRRVSRAQLLAGAALAASVAAGCSSDEPTPGPEGDAGESSSGSAQPVYGAPIPDDDGGGSAQPVYGAPVLPDAGDDGGGGVSPAYGAPGDAGAF